MQCDDVFEWTEPPIVDTNQHKFVQSKLMEIQRMLETEDDKEVVPKQDLITQQNKLFDKLVYFNGYQEALLSSSSRDYHEGGSMSNISKK